MFFQDAAEDYLKFIALEKRYSARTVGTYKWWLSHYARFILESGYPAPVRVTDAFSTPLLRRFQQGLAERKLRSRTILAAFYGLRGLGDYLVTNKVLPANPVRDLTMPKKGAAERHTVSTQEIKKMLIACGLQRDKQRIAYERALLTTLALTGVRAQELLDMRLPDVRFDAKTLLVPHGKGDKARTLYPPDEWWQAMREWFALRPPCSHDWVWAQDRGRRISVETLRRDLEDIKARAGLSHATWIKPHALRRAFASRMLSNGATLTSIQASLGHSDAQTTLQYLHFSEQAAQDMSRLASLDASDIPLKEQDARPHDLRKGGASRPLPATPSEPPQATPPPPRVEPVQTQRRAADMLRRRRLPPH